MTEPFGARLRRAMDERGPLCVGIDPHAALLADCHRFAASMKQATLPPPPR